MRDTSEEWPTPPPALSFSVQGFTDLISSTKGIVPEGVEFKEEALSILRPEEKLALAGVQCTQPRLADVIKQSKKRIVNNSDALGEAEKLSQISELSARLKLLKASVTKPLVTTSACVESPVLVVPCADR